MRISALLFILLVLGAGCRSTRKISTAMTIKEDTALVVINPAASDSAKLVQDIFGIIEKKHIEFNTFSAKVKMDYKDSKDRSYDFNAFIRIRKDSVMWVSVIAALGIEAFRVLITPDSVMIQDKLNKTIQYQTVTYLQEITQLPFDFSTLQDLIIGNPVYVSGEVKTYKDDGNLVTMSMLGSLFKHLMTFEKSEYNLMFSKLDDVDMTRSRSANLAYDKYEPNGKWQFATVRRITVAEKTRVDVDMEFKQVEFDKPQNYPFNIPRGYKLK
jgi:Domain of unknown function (DUF4292)